MQSSIEPATWPYCNTLRKSEQRQGIADDQTIQVLSRSKLRAQGAVSPAQGDSAEHSALDDVVQCQVALPFLLLYVRHALDVIAFEIAN